MLDVEVWLILNVDAKCRTRNGILYPCLPGARASPVQGDGAHALSYHVSAEQRLGEPWRFVAAEPPPYHPGFSRVDLARKQISQRNGAPQVQDRSTNFF